MSREGLRTARIVLTLVAWSFAQCLRGLPSVLGDASASCIRRTGNLKERDEGKQQSSGQQLRVMSVESTVSHHREV